jgi:hypothetical protein
MRDMRVDKAAGQTLSSEATGLLSKSLAARVANCEAAGLSFSQLGNRSESQANKSAMDFLVMGGMLDASQHRGGFNAAFVNSMLDTGGNKVSLDAATGKLLTTDSGGRTIDYDAKLASEQSSQRNATIIPALFMGSPFALLGMAATTSITDSVQTDQHRSETNRIRTQLGGAADAASAEARATQPSMQMLGQQNFNPQKVNPHNFHAQNFAGQNVNTPKGYVSDVTMMSSLISQEKKLATSTHDMYTLPGLAPELFTNQRFVERNSRARENEKKTKKKSEMEKAAGVDRKRQQMRVKLATDRSSLTVANLTKEKQQLENDIELSRGKASLAEASRMHSELEVLEKAITRLTRLGM